MAPQAHVHNASDTSHLSIHERIALMNGQTCGGGYIQNGHEISTPMKPNTIVASVYLPKHVKPQTPFKPQTPPKPQTSQKPQTPYKSKTPLKPVQQHTDNLSYPGVSQQFVMPDVQVESRTGIDHRPKQLKPEMMVTSHSSAY